MTVAAVAAAAFAGAVCRYLVHVTVEGRTRTWPLGTLTVNTTGSLALGLLIGLSLRHGLDDRLLAVAGTGFLGAYTTFSTFGYETMRLVEEGATGRATANIAASLGVGLGAAAAGLAIGLAT